MKELYEIFRIEEGVPLFLGDHIRRLYSGAKKANIHLNISQIKVKRYIYSYIARESIIKGNFRLSFYFSPQERIVKKFEGRFLQPRYPSEDLYRKGIRCSIMQSERIHPETKIANTELRVYADKLIQSKDVFEVLLENHYGKITEGSRSNVFFISNDCLITAPDDLVLPGIVRQKTLELARDLKIPINYHCLDVINEIRQMNAAFITGTSPRILPIRSIDNINFDPDNDVIQLLMSKFKETISNYIKKNKR